MKTFILSVLIAISGCNFEEARRDGKSKIFVYEVICKHPKRGFVSYYVKDNYIDVRTHKPGSAIWVFRDIKGVLVKTSLGCYTDSTMKGFVKR